MNDELDLTAVAADDALLDALASGSAPVTDDAAARLLGALRRELDVTTATTATPAAEAVASSRRWRSRFTLSMAAAAAVVAFFAGTVVSSDPGHPFYPVRKLVVGADDVGEARRLLDSAEQEVQVATAAWSRRDVARTRLHATAALTALERAKSQIGDVADDVEQGGLEARYDYLRDAARDLLDDADDAAEDPGDDGTPGPSTQPSRAGVPGVSPSEDDHSGSGGGDDEPTPSRTDDSDGDDPDDHTTSPEPERTPDDDSSGSGSGSGSDSSGSGSGADDATDDS